MIENKSLVALALSMVTIACVQENQPPAAPALPSVGHKNGDAPATGEKRPLPPLPAELAPPASPRLSDDGSGSPSVTRIREHFAGLNTGRVYIQTDKPLYQSGDSIWFRGWSVDSKTLRPRPAAWHIYELVSPKGSVVLSRRIKAEQSAPANDFELPEGVPGGIYTIRMRTSNGLRGSKEVVVSNYEAPRLKKKLEFMRKTYGVGDTVRATFEVKRATGAPLANQRLQPLGSVDGRNLDIPLLNTNARGEATITFELPKTIRVADGLLSVMVEDGGITETISKRIPIVLNTVQLGFFPEGGDLIAGLESRLYFEAKNTLGKPADVSGTLVDDIGNTVAEFSTFHKGLGRVVFTPATGRAYHAEINKPVGVTEKYKLPLAKAEGCVLRTYDDVDGQVEALRARVSCTEEREVTIVGTLRDETIDTAKVRAGPQGATVYLQAPESQIDRQGVARVTVFGEGYVPLAERVVFRNRRKGLEVSVTVDKTRYSPRDKVALTLETKDAAGHPVAAELAVSVVDDTVVSFADDKSGHLTSQLLFESEIPGKVEEPKFFLDLTEEKSALALELLMGTRGYRQFNWRVLDRRRSMRRPRAAAFQDGLAMAGAQKMAAVNKPVAIGAVPEPEPLPAPAPPQPARPQPVPAPQLDDDLAQEAADFEMPEVQSREMDAPAEAMVERLAPDDKDWAARKALNRPKPVVEYAAVREFPLPDYSGGLTGTRSDFRDTVYWNPRVITDDSGTAQVTFFLNDSVTSFRVFAEGSGDNSVGREEETFESSLPFSLNVRLPLEVSADDRPTIPLTLNNEQDKSMQVTLEANFGQMLTAEETLAPEIDLGPNERQSRFYPLTVNGLRGQTEVRFIANAVGGQDTLVRAIKVVPTGFPKFESKSGTVTQNAKAEIDLTGSIQGTARARVLVYPSVTATLVSGLEGMLQEPYGCFEQTSSSNYPNVLVMDYLQSTGQGDATVLARAGTLIDKGYQRLVGFETAEKGYEWFGGTPAHEALTAYGVLEFTDMKRVYGGVDDTMLARTVNYLDRRKDGKGGFKRDAQALDSFGRADPKITDAYITYAVTEAGYGKRFGREVAKLGEHAKTSNDPYVLALAANTLLTLPSHQTLGQSTLARLVANQKSDGSFDGASHSITRSTGPNLSVETTGLAVLAMLKTDTHVLPAQKAVTWLASQRQRGTFGATQATVMALRAITEFGRSMKRTRKDGSVTLTVNGEVLETQKYRGKQSEPLVFDGLEKYLTAGPNRFELQHEGDGGVPYEIAVEHYVNRGADHPQAGLSLETSIAETSLEMGDTVRLTAVLQNTLDEGRPMTLARIGLPGGLTFQTWQLKELKDQKLIDFYETKEREVVLYLRQMTPGQSLSVPLELIATVPGVYTSPASRAYLYYTDDRKVWADPITVEIKP